MQSIAICPSPLGGRGAFAVERIPAGTSLGEYSGIRLSEAEYEEVFGRITRQWEATPERIEWCKRRDAYERAVLERDLALSATAPSLPGLTRTEAVLLRRAAIESGAAERPLPPAPGPCPPPPYPCGRSGCYIVMVHIDGGDRLIVDAEDEAVSSWHRFINHDNHPNCAFKSRSLEIVTVKEIERGAELTIDYSAEYWKGMWFLKK
jgi:hypothetical protein